MILNILLFSFSPLKAWMAFGKQHEQDTGTVGNTPLDFNRIDSDELLHSPLEGMQRYCEAIGIPYLEKALGWVQKADENQAINPTWNTDGLEKQKRDYPTLDSNPDIQRLYEASLPHYTAMKAHRLALTG